jgi:hypothetical protein
VLGHSEPASKIGPNKPPPTWLVERSHCASFRQVAAEPCSRIVLVENSRCLMAHLNEGSYSRNTVESVLGFI